MPTTMARNDQNVLSTRADLGHDLERRGVVEGYKNKFSVRGIKPPILISNFSLQQWSRRKISSRIPGRASYVREGARLFTKQLLYINMYLYAKE